MEAGQLEGWTWPDVWVFAAISNAAIESADGKARLWRVIGQADWIEKLVISHELLSQTVGRLSGAGLVTTEPDNALSLTESGRVVLDGTPWGLCRQTWLDAVRKRLAEVSPPPESVDWGLPQAAYDEAVGLWEAYFRRATGKLSYELASHADGPQPRSEFVTQ